MIKHLHIQNYAIIDEVTINFSDNLTIITGETGAGKSILMGALGLIMGDRTESKVLYDEGRKCIVEGHFDILFYNLQSLFEELDLDYDTELIIRREITPSGRSRAFVNDTPVRLDILRQLSSRLIDLHRQFDTLDIQNEDFQLKMLDALGDNKTLLEDYSGIYQSYKNNQRLLKKKREEHQKAANELDFFNFLLEELATAELENGEQEELEDELSKLTNAEDIKMTLNGAFQQLSEDEMAIISQLREVGNQIATVKDFDKRLPAIYERFSGIIEELQDVAEELEGIGEETEYDEARIAEVQERVDLIYKLQKKHQVATIDELLQIQEDYQLKVDGVTDTSEDIERLEKEIYQQERQLQTIAAELSKRRVAVVPSFENKIHKMLATLSMEVARIQIKLSPLPQLSPTGLDQVTYLFSANKGGRMLPIKQAASGGELSRLTLCTKSLVANAIPLPTMIFDEIDSGVSGDVAGRMGSILRKLSDNHQVVVITHTPQIAAKADTHYFVYKNTAHDRTKTHVKLLDREERVTEIATMLSGNPPSQYAISNAVDLLSR